MQCNRSGSTSSPAPSKAIAGWALARVIDRDRSYARVGERLGEPKIVGRILGAEHPDQHCAAAAPTRNGVLLWAHLCVAFEAEFSKPGGNTDPDRAPVATSPPSKILIYLHDLNAAQAYANAWIDAVLLADRLPATVPSVEQHTGPALMIRAHGRDEVRHAWDPALQAVVIRIGNFTWRIRDRAAYDTMRAAWMQVRQLAPIILRRR